jgi:tetratricopeptide (TPR) repeat protein
VAIALPFLMLAQEAWFGSGRPLRGRAGAMARTAALAPPAIAVLAYLVLRTDAIGEFPGLQIVPPQDNPIVLLDGMERTATVLGVAGRYLVLLLLPLRLSPDYSGAAFPVENAIGSPLPLLGLAFLAALTLLAALPLLRPGAGDDGRETGGRARVVSMGALLFLLPYLVVGNLLVLNAAGFAERLLYVPAAGFCILLAVALHLPIDLSPAPRRRVVRLAVYSALSLLLVAGALQTRSQARMWESDDSLVEWAMAAAPGSLRANLELARRYRQEERWDEAKRIYETIAEGNPADAQAWLDLGILLGARGELQRAETVLRRAIALEPALGEAHYRLGLVLAATARPAEAERALRRTLLLSPGRIQAAVALADLYYRAGRYEMAARYYRGCVGLGRNDLLPRLRAAEARAARAE